MSQLLADLPNTSRWRIAAPDSRPSQSRDQEKIQETITYMMLHLDQPLQVATLARLVSISCSHYFAMFKRCTGHTPIDFFIRLRMQCACQLLETTSLSVKEIAAVLGYADPFYFSRLFKSVTKVAPREHRALGKKTGARPGLLIAGYFSNRGRNDVDESQGFRLADHDPSALTAFNSARM